MEIKSTKNTKKGSEKENWATKKPFDSDLRRVYNIGEMCVYQQICKMIANNLTFELNASGY